MAWEVFLRCECDKCGWAQRIVITDEHDEMAAVVKASDDGWLFSLSSNECVCKACRPSTESEPTDACP